MSWNLTSREGGRVVLDLEHHGTRLLEWLGDQPDHIYSDITEFIGEEGLPQKSGRALAENLSVASPGR